MAHSNPPPSLPEVFDEAGNSPRWVPVLGIGLLILFAIAASTSFTVRGLQPSAAPQEQTAQPTS